MKKLLLTLLAAWSINLCNAQDVITRNDSSKVTASIIEINPREIKYKLFNYADGPTISNNREQVAYITFKNGSVERFTKVEPNIIIGSTYDPNRYNMDATRVSVYSSESKIKKCEKLYTRKNYIGFNYTAFLNTCMAFNYMRDVKKANLIINVPFAFGMGSPSITNSLYGRNYLDGTLTTKYDRLIYQIGLNALFAPSMTREVNFLMGPAFNLSEYNVSVNTLYTTKLAGQGEYNDGQFTNQFRLRREHYGINIGLLARFSEKVNMNMLITFGYKQDTYNQKDPYGFESINANAKTRMVAKDNVMPYVNFAWSVGYRF